MYSVVKLPDNELLSDSKKAASLGSFYQGSERDMDFIFRAQIQALLSSGKFLFALQNAFMKSLSRELLRALLYCRNRDGMTLW